MMGKDHLRDLLVDFRDRFAVPALGAALISRNGTLELDVIGDRRRNAPDPVTTTDQWHIGSCAKAITAALYARLVYATKGGDVRDVMCQGQWLMRERELLTLDEQALLDEAAVVASKIDAFLIEREESVLSKLLVIGQVATLQQCARFLVMRDYERGANREGGRVAVKMEGGNVLGRDLVVLYHGGVGHDVAALGLQDAGGCLGAAEILVAVGQSFDNPAGFQINEHRQIIRRATRIEPFDSRRFSGTWISSRPERYAPVIDLWFFSRLFGVPAWTISPPLK